MNRAACPKFRHHALSFILNDFHAKSCFNSNVKISKPKRFKINALSRATIHMKPTHLVSPDPQKSTVKC